MLAIFTLRSHTSLLNRRWLYLQLTLTRIILARWCRSMHSQRAIPAKKIIQLSLDQDVKTNYPSHRNQAASIAQMCMETGSRQVKQTSKCRNKCSRTKAISKTAGQIGHRSTDHTHPTTTTKIFRITKGIPCISNTTHVAMKEDWTIH